jgi:hypothetical protein
VELVTQQVVAIAIVHDSHFVEAFVVILFHGHLFIDGTDLRIGDGSLGIGGCFGETFAVGYLGGDTFSSGR